VKTLAQKSINLNHVDLPHKWSIPFFLAKEQKSAMNFNVTRIFEAIVIAVIIGAAGFIFAIPAIKSDIEVVSNKVDGLQKSTDKKLDGLQNQVTKIVDDIYKPVFSRQGSK